MPKKVQNSNSKKRRESGGIIDRNWAVQDRSHFTITNLIKKTTTLITLAFALCVIASICSNNAFCMAKEEIPNETPTVPPVVCPMNLTDSLPCLCYVPSGMGAVQILCNNTQLDLVWAKLGGYNTPIDKIAIRNCPEPGDIQQVPALKIRSLEITSCTIGQIQPNAFDSLAGTLEELWLLNASLTAVPRLAKLKKLASLNLNRNQIKDFPDHTLLGLKELKHLRLRNNQLCSLSNPLLDQRNSLELLDLAANCLHSIPATTIRGCLELRWLSLAWNRLHEIGPMQFMSLPKLVELRMYGNQLQRVAPNGFMNVPALELLMLQNNSLSHFEQGTLQTFSRLQLVDLSSNEFSKIPSFKDLSELVEVRLDDNRIAQIETLTFSANPKLKQISLASNQIESIARNSFDALDQLEQLNLADNALTVIDKGTLEGMRHLKDLILRHNSIAELNRNSFLSVPELTGLDLGENELKTLRAGTFAPLEKLHMLKLDGNHIETMEKGAFTGKVDNLLLDGNPLRCDSQLDWFIDWLVKNKVRTFVPDQPDIKCASPEAKRGTRLKDLMIQRQNISEQLVQSLHNIPGISRGAGGEDPNGAGNFLANFLPNIGRQAQGAQMGSQMLNGLAQTFPEMRRYLPNTIPTSTPGGGKTLDSAIDQFSEPLVKFATGAQPSPADVNQLLTSIPSLVVNVPGFGNVDVSKLNPSLVEYVLKGGQIPGIPRETLNHLVKQYMQRLYVAAAQAQGVQPSPGMPQLPPGTNTSRMLRPVSELPHGLVKSVIEGRALPHLTTEQTSVIREYYTQHAPVGALLPDEDALEGSGDGGPVNVTDLLPKKVIQMMQLLPRNYNLSRLPPELVRQVMRGEMPDLTKLPLDLQQYIKDNFDRLMGSLQQNTPDVSMEEILRKLPIFEQPTMSTFSPYDINTVDSDLVVKQRKSAADARFWRICTAVALGLAGAVTLGVLSAFCWYWHRTNRNCDPDHTDDDGFERRCTGVLPTVVREQSFRPSASSTLK